MANMIQDGIGGQKSLKRMAAEYAVVVIGYIVLVAWIMNLAPILFGRISGIWGPVAFLLLFVLSAAITGALVLGKPILLYLEGAKQEAVKLFIYTIGFLAGALILAFLILALVASFV